MVSDVVDAMAPGGDNPSPDGRPAARALPLTGLDAYRSELTRIAGHDERVVCLEAGPDGVQGHPFEAARPDRFFRLGTVEVAMVGMAKGLAVAGFRPFVSTFAPHRETENLELTIGYLSAGATVIAPYEGAPLNFAALRRVPGVILASPYGEAETRAVVRVAAQLGRPHYIRIGRGTRHASLPWEGAGLPMVNWESTGAPAWPCLVSAGETGTALALAARRAAPALGHAHLVYLSGAPLAAAAERIAARHSRLVVVGGYASDGGLAQELAALLPGCEVVGVPLGRGEHVGAAEVHTVLEAAGLAGPRG
ncbi:transketolase [Streptomyces sp. NPDC006632]|uniref:transketolase n=1 Tax=unclassified Streptomyces TaxID=2593676 RepID=UPI002E200537